MTMLILPSHQFRFLIKKHPRSILELSSIRQGRISTNRLDTPNPLMDLKVTEGLWRTKIITEWMLEFRDLISTQWVVFKTLRTSTLTVQAMDSETSLHFITTGITVSTIRWSWVVMVRVIPIYLVEEDWEDQVGSELKTDSKVWEGERFIMMVRAIMFYIRSILLN